MKDLNEFFESAINNNIFIEESSREERERKAKLTKEEIETEKFLSDFDDVVRCYWNGLTYEEKEEITFAPKEKRVELFMDKFDAFCSEVAGKSSKDIFENCDTHAVESLHAYFVSKIVRGFNDDLGKTETIDQNIRDAARANKNRIIFAVVLVILVALFAGLGAVNINRHHAKRGLTEKNIERIVIETNIKIRELEGRVAELEGKMLQGGSIAYKRQKPVMLINKNQEGAKQMEQRGYENGR